MWKHMMGENPQKHAPIHEIEENLIGGHIPAFDKHHDEIIDDFSGRKRRRD